MALQLESVARKTRKVLIYGDWKTRKTSAAAMFPAPLVAQDAMARGADFLTCPRVTLTNLADLSELAGFVAKQKDVGTVLLDDFGAMVQRWVAKFDEKDPRANYREAYKVIVPALQRLMAMSVNVVMTTHYEVEDEITPEGKLRKWVHPNLPDALRTYVGGMFDVVAYAYKREPDTFTCLTREKVNAQRRISAGVRVGLDVPESVGTLELGKTVLK